MKKGLAILLIFLVVAIAGCVGSQKPTGSSNVAAAYSTPTNQQTPLNATTETFTPAPTPSTKSVCLEILKEQTTISAWSDPSSDSFSANPDSNLITKEQYDDLSSIPCHKGGIYTGENIKYVYCSFQTGCNRREENNVVIGWSNIRITSWYEIGGKTEIARRKKFDPEFIKDLEKIAGPQENPDLINYNISLILKDCKWDIITKPDIVECAQARFLGA